MSIFSSLINEIVMIINFYYYFSTNSFYLLFYLQEILHIKTRLAVEERTERLHRDKISYLKRKTGTFSKIFCINHICIEIQLSLNDFVIPVVKCLMPHLL